MNSPDKGWIAVRLGLPDSVEVVIMYKTHRRGHFMVLSLAKARSEGS